VDGGPANVREYSVPVPGIGDGYIYYRAMFHNGVALSPQGDRLAWILQVKQDPPGPFRRFLSRWMPSLQRAPEAVLEMRTTRLDGSDVHVIGHMALPKPDPKAEYPGQLQWLPDGKRLSFVYKSVLYTVPAD